jgi:hypothetical protein
MCLDLAVEDWWKQYSGETDHGWQTRFTDYLEELASNRVPDETLVTLLQKHHKRPFVEICLDNEGEPDCGPAGVSDGDIGDDYASLADLLEGCIGDVGKAPTYSICSAETGKLLYGVPWKTEDNVEEDDKEEKE